jgi:hypothetical protein
MRIGEALRLRPADIDPNAGVLTVRATKKGTDRLVALHDSTTAALTAYQIPPARTARPAMPKSVKDKGHIGIGRACGLSHKMGCREPWNTLAERWQREVTVVRVRQAKGLLCIGSAVKAAVSAAEKPRPAK